MKLVPPLQFFVISRRGSSVREKFCTTVRRNIGFVTPQLVPGAEEAEPVVCPLSCTWYQVDLNKAKGLFSGYIHPTLVTIGRSVSVKMGHCQGVGTIRPERFVTLQRNNLRIWKSALTSQVDFRTVIPVRPSPAAFHVCKFHQREPVLLIS